MVFVPCPNVAQVELIYNCASQTVENVFHVQMSGGWNTTTLTNLANDFVTWYTGHLAATQGGQVGLVEVKVTDLTTQTSGVVIVNPSPVPFGSNAGSAAPNHVTLAIKWLTANRGRSFRGRTYHVGILQSFLTPDGQGITATIGNNIVAAYNTLITAMSGTAGRSLVVLSRYHGVDPTTKRPIPRSSGVATPIISANATDFFVDSQRRRLIAHNRHR